MKDEIIIYQADKASTRLEVRIEQETVWLTQAQMVELFDSTKQNISLHINNIFKEEELIENSVVKFSLTTAADRKKYKTKYYNLDVIISVGYRVKSKRGTQFRIWANKILKEYLLKGYALNNRMNRIEENFDVLSKRLDGIDLQINASLPPNQGVFFDGQMFDAYAFAAGLIKKAKESIILIDNFIDESVLLMLSKRQKGVNAIIYTSVLTKVAKLDLKKFSSQYPDIEIKQFTKSHDRFLIIDQMTVYHIGASLKDLGKKWFAFSIINFEVENILKRLNC